VRLTRAFLPLLAFASISFAQINTSASDGIINAYERGVQLRLQREKQQQEAAFRAQMIEIERQRLAIERAASVVRRK
jgi:hypothetical protein